MNSLAILIGSGATLAAYCAARAVNARRPSPWTNPVVLAVPCVIAALVIAGIDYPAYRAATMPLADLLGPATVALALPLYRQRAAIAGRAAAALGALLAGSLATAAIACALSRVAGLDDTVARAMAIKSATAPIALQAAQLAGADPALAAVLAIATGMCGALLGPRVLDACGVRDPLERGLAYGTISHGIGTVQAGAESELGGAVSAVAMGLGSMTVALIVPPLLRWLA